MKKTLNIVLTALLLSIASVPANAQTDYEYRMEIGGGVGLMAYEGDFNGSILHNMQPSASLMLRRVINPYMDLRLAASYGKLKGSSKDVKTYLPQYQDTQYDFSTTLVDLSATYEYNFWPYGTGNDYRGAQRLTPFIFAGIGTTYASTPTGNVFTANLPLGLGIKYKVAPRLNLGIEWAMHFSLNDKLDGIADPYGIQSTGMFKNTDCFSALQLTLTYSFMPKCRTCHNDDD
ncbi:DUF6089 family protein [uncultured Prevotella sp.]|uniref:type IX secretion system protein PorG n=1 Tax=uncultured Prevotella sp. TaxID=159272 RepID=UPI00260FC0C3|nr:DUF6089 family protein [uncultured Prevotella sp.]